MNAKIKHRRSEAGATLVELLMAIVISSIALFALAMPLVAGQRFWRSGRQRVEAQRDAQAAFRAIAKLARDSSAGVISGGPGSQTISFTRACGGVSTIQAGPSVGTGRFVVNDACSGKTFDLIDGTRSRVTQFTLTKINSKLVHVHLVVTHQNCRNETLDTEMFLCNAP